MLYVDTEQSIVKEERRLLETSPAIFGPKISAGGALRLLTGGATGQNTARSGRCVRNCDDEGAYYEK